MNHSGNAAKRGRRTAQMKLPPGGAQHAWKCSQWHVEVISGRTQFFNNFPQVRPSESDFQIKLSERKRATQTRADVALSAVASCYETRGVECTIQLSGDFTVKTDTKSRNPHLSIPFVCHVIIIIILRAYYKRWWCV